MLVNLIAFARLENGGVVVGIRRERLVGNCHDRNHRFGSGVHPLVACVLGNYHLQAGMEGDLHWAAGNPVQPHAQGPLAFEYVHGL